MKGKYEMQIKPLYEFKRADGGVTRSLEKPTGDYAELYRIIADEGKAVSKDGEKLFCVIDTDNPDEYYEADDPREAI